jgi:hypothetical protein
MMENAEYLNMDNTNGNSISMSDEVPHAYDQEYTYSEVSSFEYENKLDRFAMKSGRPNHHIITIKDPKNQHKKAKVSVFTTSSTLGAPIVNAVSGVPYDASSSAEERYVVGSKNESTLFKVRDVTGRIENNNGFLFYDSPSQYERHLLVNLNKTVHESWATRHKQGLFVQ